MSKFDVMLIFVFVLIATVLGMTFYQTVMDYDQFSAGFWTFITAVCGGEIVTFSLYRITKEKYERKTEKAAKEENKDNTNNICPTNLLSSTPLISATEAAIADDVKIIAENTDDIKQDISATKYGLNEDGKGDED